MGVHHHLATGEVVFSILSFSLLTFYVRVEVACWKRRIVLGPVRSFVCSVVSLMLSFFLVSEASDEANVVNR